MKCKLPFLLNPLTCQSSICKVDLLNESRPPALAVRQDSFTSSPGTLPINQAIIND